MKAYTLISLAAAAAFASSAATAEPQGTTAVLDAYISQEEGVASLTDADCIAVVNYIRRYEVATLLAAADGIEQEEAISEYDFIRKATTLPMDGMPDDLCTYIRESVALVNGLEEKLRPIEEELEELQRSGDDDAREQAKPLIKQYRAIHEQFKKDSDALDAKYPRATFLSKHLGSRAASSAACDLRNEQGKAQDFLAAHPTMKKGKRATMTAYFRHLANEQQPEVTPQYARNRVRKLDLISRLDFSEDGIQVEWTMWEENTKPIIFPDDRRSGYTWQLASPLPEDSPVQIEWHTLPSSELKELQDIGVLSSWHDVPGSPHCTVASLRAMMPGKVTLNFIYARPEEEAPLLRMRVTVDVKTNDED